MSRCDPPISGKRSEQLSGRTRDQIATSQLNAKEPFDLIAIVSSTARPKR